MSRQQSIQSIVNTIQDYRQGEITRPDVNHVDRWIKQFDKAVQDDILDEMVHVLNHSYLSKQDVEQFLQNLITNIKLTGTNHCAFWKDATFLNIQGGGNSQKDMLKLFDGLLQEACGFGISGTTGKSDDFIYMDDFMFSGSRIRNDIGNWIRNKAPQHAKIHVIVVGLHSYGEWYTTNKLKEIVASTGKTVNFQWWRGVTIEDRKFKMSYSDVLRPATLPNEPLVNKYVDYLKTEGYAPILRKPADKWCSNFFSSEIGRQLLETEFLRKGAWIYDECPFNSDVFRPLGFNTLKMLGFGSTLVTFRNCPNTTPLTYWAGDPWYPLFPRKKN